MCFVPYDKVNFTLKATSSGTSSHRIAISEPGTNTFLFMLAPTSSNLIYQNLTRIHI